MSIIVEGESMNPKERFILASTMSSMMVAVVTLVATLLNLGIQHDILLQWAKAYVIAWPVAALVGFLVLPMSRRFARRLVGLF